MRKIKFRAWDDNKKIMKEPFGIGRQGQATDIFGDYNYPVMQYIGLKDKNGKEIYEGDIVKYKCCLNKNLTGFVEYSGWQYVVTQVVPNRNSTAYFGFNSEDVESNEMEVIGNIYENPELLN